MDVSKCVIVLVTDDPQQRAAWRGALAELIDDGVMVIDGHEPPADEQATVVVSDQDDVRQRMAPAGQAGDDELCGWVLVGAEGSADVRLPLDASPRELCTACRLLLEIVRLRRECRAGQRHQQQLADLAHTDPLTRLPNRRDWDAQLAKLLAGDELQTRGVCLALVDLDWFKRINEQHGHAVGDRVLQNVGRALRGSVRQHDLVARLGGDEFGLCLLEMEPGAAESAVERIRRRSTSLLAAERLPAMTASAGLVEAATLLEPTIETLFGAADAALRRAKSSGRDRSVVARGE